MRRYRPCPGTRAAAVICGPEQAPGGEVARRSARGSNRAEVCCAPGLRSATRRAALKPVSLCGLDSTSVHIRITLANTGGRLTAVVRRRGVVSGTIDDGGALAGVGHTPCVPECGPAPRFLVPLPSLHELRAAFSLYGRPRVGTVCSRVLLLSQQGSRYSTVASEPSSLEWLLEYRCSGVT